mmetsp:Transcript_34506/g.80643  ORF Transcript_34506/g.80643 Transcript_34506/m.80643 type:complete len:222 (+) Transcript_34506:305-970(+)
MLIMRLLSSQLSCLPGGGSCVEVDIVALLPVICKGPRPPPSMEDEESSIIDCPRRAVSRVSRSGACSEPSCSCCCCCCCCCVAGSSWKPLLDCMKVSPAYDLCFSFCSSCFAICSCSTSSFRSLRIFSSTASVLFSCSRFSSRCLCTFLLTCRSCTSESERAASNLRSSSFSACCSACRSSNCLLAFSILLPGSSCRDADEAGCCCCAAPALFGEGGQPWE